MSISKNTVYLLALFAVLSLASAAYQDHVRVKRQAVDDPVVDFPEDVEADDEDDAVVLDDLLKDNKNKNWTTCDWRATAKFTCYDCNTRMICKPVGGILKYCSSTNTPHCRNGFCSAIPSDECAVAVESAAEVEETEDTIEPTDEFITTDE